MTLKRGRIVSVNVCDIFDQTIQQSTKNISVVLSADNYIPDIPV